MRVVPDQYNYRSPQKYVSAANQFKVEFSLLDGHFKVREGFAVDSSLRHRRKNENVERQYQMIAHLGQDHHKFRHRLCKCNEKVICQFNKNLVNLTSSEGINCTKSQIAVNLT